MEFLSTTIMESWSIQMKIFLMALWWDCIYSLRFICCISNLLWTAKLDNCNLYFIVDIFRSCPVIFPFTLEVFHVRFGVLVLDQCLLEREWRRIKSNYSIIYILKFLKLHCTVRFIAINKRNLYSIVQFSTFFLL